MTASVLEGFRLSPQQERLALLHREGVCCHVQSSFLLTGEVDSGLLRRAAAAVVGRHEILRTVFVRLEGMEVPIQVISEDPTLAFREIDLRGVGEAERPAAVEEVLAHEHGTDFDLERGPAARFTLILLAPARAVLAVTSLSLWGDLSSLRSLVAELARTYSGGEPGETPVQYVDISGWQHDLLTAEEGRKGRDYWRRQVGSEVPIPALPFAASAGGPGGQPFTPRSLARRAAAPLIASLERLAAEHEASLEHVFLAVWFALLRRYSEGPDLLVGRLDPGRKYADLASALGPFAKLLPVRLTVDLEEPFARLLRQTSEMVREGKTWEEYFSWRDAAPAVPSWPLGFSYEEPVEELGGGAVRFFRHSESACLDRLPLELAVVRASGSLVLTLRYDATHFAGESIERLAEELETLLASAAAAPGSLVGDLEFLGPGERQRLLEAWQGPVDELRGDLSLHRRFEAQASRAPDALAVSFGGEQLSFGELDARSQRLARGLARRGIGAESLVVLALERSVDLVVAVLGALKAGGAFVPVDPLQPAERLALLLEDVRRVGLPLVLTHQRLVPLLPAGDLPVLVLDDPEIAAALAVESAAGPSAAVDPEALAYVIFTSGSTGRPKGVMLRHRGAVNLVSALAGSVYADMPGPLRVSVNAPLSFDAAIKQVVQLLHGRSLHPVPDEVRADPEALLGFLEQQEIEVLDCTPSQLRLLLGAGLLERSGLALRLALVGGEAIDFGMWERLAGCAHTAFWNVYGPTECTVDATARRIAGPVSTIGGPLANVRAYVLDARLRPVPAGMPGELVIGGAGVGRGYLGHPELTAWKFIPDPFGAPGDRCYRTGDAVRHRLDGTLEFLGRIDLQVKVRGYRIELEEIEAVLREHPGVAEAAVAAREEAPGDVRLAAYVVSHRRYAAAIDGRSRHELPNRMSIVEQNRNETEYLYREIFAQRCYVRHGIELPDDACVFDVGANIGMFTLFVHQECARPRVYAFEPLGPMYEALRINCELYAPAARLFPFGLSDGERLERFTFYPRYTMMSGQSRYARPDSEAEVVKRYLQNQRAGGAAEVAVLVEQAEDLLEGRFEGQLIEARLRRLSDVLGETGVERIDLLKVDVQRAELDVLRGIDGADWARIDQVVMEVHDAPGDDSEGRVPQILALLEEQGFEGVAEQDDLLLGTDRHNLYAMRRGLVRRERRGERSQPEGREFPRELNASELRDLLRQRLPEPMVPSHLFLLERLPLNRSGKVDRAALPAPESLAGGAAPERAAPRTPFEEVLATIWREVLDLPEVGVDESFFDLGGHSLLATQLMSRVRAALGVGLPLRALFDQPTVAGLARQAEAAFRAGGELEAPPVEPVPRTAALPLSFGQQGLWFLHQMAPEDPTYNSPKVLVFHGPLKAAVLAAALSEIVRRHEVLRTCLPNVDGEPVQRIAPPSLVSLPEIDLAALPEAARGAEARRLAQREAERPFDLAREAPLRVVLLRVDDEERHVLFTLHHVASDAWSLGVLSREVSALYLAFSDGRPSPLAELPIQYADYAAWQRNWLHGEVLDLHLDYWRRRLAVLPAVLDLPVDRPRQAVRSHHGDRVTLAIPADARDRLDALGRSLGATRYMVLLAAFQAFLARTSGQEDLAVGTPVAGRDRLELEPLIGLFVNMLVMRGDLRGDPAFIDMVGRTREAALAAYAHQALPFETLVDALQPERSLSHAPLFQVMFALQSVSREDLALPRLRVDAIEAESHVARFDLSLGVQEAGSGLLASLEYSAELFDAATILRFAGAFERLLSSFVAEPVRPLSQASPWSGAERWQVLGEWNDTERELSAAASVHGLVEAQVDRTPEAEALLQADADEGASALTYRELDGLANRIAHHLLSLGLGAEARVGLCHERTPEMVAALLGVLKAGAAYVPLDPSFPGQRLALIAEDAGLALLVTREALLDRLPEWRAGAVCLDRDAAVIAGRPSTRPAVAWLPESLAYVLYTSGSTGRPKGVAVPHGAVVNFLAAMRRRPGLSRGETLLAVTTLSFDIAVLELLLPLTVGARVALVGRHTTLDGARLVRALDDARAAVMQATPATWRLLLEAGWPGGESFRVLCGGEALPADLAAALLTRSGELWNLYGPTETTVWSAVHRVTAPVAPVALPLGRPVDNTEIYLLDGGLMPVPLGAVGELYIGGTGVARGYLSRPDLTAERFLPDPFGAAGSRLYRVGDMARWRRDGTLDFLGRVDHQVKVRGFRIELGEIEAVLVRHPAVAEAVAVAVRPGGATETRLVAYVIAAPAAELEVSALRGFLQASLPAYMVPSAFVLLPALPRTPNDKVDRRALPAPEISAATGEALVAPRTPVEELVAGIWAEVLGVAHVGVEEDFFALGGHSLLAIRVLSRVRMTLRVELPLRSLFAAPTVAGWAAAVDRARRTAAGTPASPPLARVAREGELALSYAQQRLWFLDQLEPDSPLYNLPATMRLEGELDVPALQRSLTEIVRRHEVLRTHYPVRAGLPVQEIAPASALLLPMTDLGRLDPVRREAELQVLAQAELLRPFDLLQGPVLRATLVRLGQQEHALLATVHHIASDAWSTGVVRHELSELYRAFSRGETPALAELPVQYADYAAWQRRWLEAGGLQGGLAYWRRRVAGLPEVLELPLDRPRPAVRSVRGGNHTFSLPGSLHGSLRALGRRLGATPFMMLLAGFQALLGRYAGEDVAVGTPVTGRRRVELEGLIGFLVNTLVLRVDLAGDPPFTGIVERVREAVLEAYEHDDLPFDKLVEELQPERSLSHAPLVQVVFVYQQAAAGEPELPGLRARPLAESSRAATARHDLTLAVAEQGDAVSALLNYRADLFEPPTVERLASHLRKLLAAAVDDPRRRFSELPLFGAEERQQILEWNDTADPCRPRWRALHDMFREQARRQPQAVALVQGGRRLTYGELDCWTDAVAWRLRSLGVGPEMRIALCAERSFERVVGLLAILKAGGAVLALDAAHPAERLDFLLQDSGAGVVVTRPDLLEKLPVGDRLVLLLDGMENDEEVGEGSRADGLLPENLAYVVYTSGSTGHPKACGILHSGLCNFAEAAAEVVGLSAGDGFLQFAAPSFDGMLAETVLALTSGAALCLGTEEILLPGPDLAAMMRDSGVTAMALPPSALAVLPEEELPRVRLLISAGEACTPELRNRWSAGRRFFNAYGPSETTITVTLKQLHPGERVDLGRPIPNLRIHLLDRHWMPVPVGVPGEICLAGVGLARGYLNRPALAAERFVPDPYGGLGERLYRSGDLGRRLPDGATEFMGRIDHQVKVRGFRIELGEIETALAEHEGVRDAVVLARQDAPGPARLVAYVVPAADRALRASDLRELLARRLPVYMIPAQFVFLERLPLVANGKVDRKALPAPETVLPDRDREHVAPRNPVEEVLAAIWAEALRRDRVGVHDNVFELGAHSLLITQVASRVRDTLRIDLPLRDLFEQPTVAGLAARVALARVGSAFPPLVPVRRDGFLPLSFGQERMWFLYQLEPDRPVYNLPSRFRQRGALNVPALAGAFSEIARRHEVLRTRFATVDDEVAQHIDPPGLLPLPIVDLQGLPLAVREAEARRLAIAEARRPFVLDRELPFRLGLLRLAADDHVILPTMHHIASDGWSAGILLRELIALYVALSADRPVTLPALPIQYADFAVWQRNWLRGEWLESEIAHWRLALAGLPPVLALPTDRPRPASLSYLGGTVHFALPPGLMEVLAAECGRRGMTAFMLFLAAFQALLARVTRQEELAVGTPAAGRDRGEIEGLIGFFVNTLVMRGDVRGDPSFAELLHRTREAALAAYAHQAVPFEMLVNELQPERSLSYSPLFQAMLALQEAFSSEGALAGLAPVSFDTGAGTGIAKVDLTLFVTLAGPTARCALEYSSDLFDRTTALRLADHFRTLLEDLVAEPGRAVGDAPLLDGPQRWQILREWNDSAAEAGLDLCFPQEFEAQVSLTPHAMAVTCGPASLTYSQLDRRSNRLARALIAHGAGREDVVALLGERNADFLTACLAILKAGAAYLPLDPESPARRWGQVLVQSGCRLTVVAGELVRALPTAVADLPPEAWPRLLILEDLLERDLPDGSLGVRCEPQNLAYVLFTSGSTGAPKGAMIQHQGMLNHLRAKIGDLRLTAADCVAQTAPQSFDISVWQFLAALLVGGRVHIVDRAASLDPERLIAEIDAAAVSVFQTVPSMLRAMLRDADLGERRPLALRWMIATGEALPPDLAREWVESFREVPLLNAYGPTECSDDVTHSFVAAVAADQAQVSIGRPIFNTQVHVLDGGLTPVPAGTAGELYVGGAGVGRGYLHRPDLTAERFVPDPFGAAGSRLYKVGDLARRRADGALDFLGRVDHQVKVRGFRIELGEIETVLRAHPAVKDSAVLVREDALGYSRLVAYVVQDPAALEGLFSDRLVPLLRDFLAERLPDYMTPTSFVALEALPLTPNGKVDRLALPEPAVEAVADPAAPRTPLEDLVTQIWAEVLGRERIGVEENFFALGGHSLLATRVMSRLRQVLRVELPLRALFEAPTVAGLAAAAERARRTDSAPERPPLVRVERDGDLPLSHAQQRLWFLDQLEPDSPLYNLPFSVHLEGEVDVPALRRSLEAIVARHEVLRTRFPLRDGRPLQEIVPEGRWLLPVVDLTGLDQCGLRRELRGLVQADSAQPFDLARGPVFRTSLLRLAEREHVLLATVHHIASDGWSTGVLRRELSHFYGAFSRGEEAALPELPLQYADYAVWQRGWLESGGLAAEMAHWRRRLAGAPEVLELPADRPRPAVRTARGANQAFTLSAFAWEALRSLGRRQGATPFMALLAGFQALLGRYAGEDVVLGTPVAGRQQFELEGLIGFFVNTLVLRVSLAGNPAFSGIVERVRETVLEAHEHQHLPFDRLVEDLHPRRSLSYSPLFQVLFVYQPEEAEAPGLPGLRVLPMPDELRVETARFDLSLVLTERAGAVGGFLNYSTDLFEASTVTRLLGHLQALLGSAAADPRQRLAELPLLSAAEQQALLVEWNDSVRSEPQPLCFHELFSRQAEGRPEGAAALYAGETSSYAEVEALSNRLAGYLRRLGVGPEVRVALCVERSPDFLVGILGILKAGGAYVPLDPAYPAERLAWILGDALGGQQVALLVTRAALADTFACGDEALLPLGLGRVLLDRDAEAIARESAEPLGAGVGPDNLAYAIYTSGSTGQPKGVAGTHRGLANLWAELAGRFAASGERVFQFFSPTFDGALWDLTLALASGATLCFEPREMFLTRPRELSVSTVTLPPSALPALSIEASSELRTLIVAGEACPLELARFWGRRCRFVNAYGPTEATICASYSTFREERDRLPIGRPIGNVHLHVVDQGMQPVPLGVVGELCIAGVSLARGYLGRPDLTAESFVPSPLAFAPGERLYRTGDLARYLADGEVEFLGRADHQVKVRGFRIELEEIEAALGRHERVREAVVVARQDAGAARLVAYVAPREGEDLTADELRAALSRTLPDYMVPGAFVTLESFPLLDNGKVDRKALPAAAEARRVRDDTPARNPVEAKLASLWAEALGVDRVGVYDNFFELGGDSILSIQIVARAGEAGLFLTPRQVFQHQTIAELAAEVQMAPSVLAEQAPVTGPVPLTPIQRWFFAERFAAPHHFNQAVLLQARQPLEAARVARVFAGMIRHHDALRMRFGRTGEEWWQANAGLESAAAFFHLDLSALPAQRRAPALEAAAAAAQGSLNLERGSLARALWFDLGSAVPARLLLLAHHLVVDGVSWRILLDDLVRGYQQLAAGEELRFPPKTTSFKEWAERLQDYARAADGAAEHELWLAVSAARRALPVDLPGGANLQASARTVTVALETGETEALLQEVPAAYRTQINDVLLTALVETLAAWTGEPSLVVDLEAHGREELFPGVDLSRTVGWFTTQYPVRLSLPSPAIPGAALKRIKEDLRAVGQNGISYGLLRWMASAPELCGALAAPAGQQVAFNYLGQLDQALPESSLFAGAAEPSGPVVAADAHRPAVLEISASVRSQRLRIHWEYCRELHREETVQALAEGYVGALRRLIEHCRSASGGLTSSDLPLLRLGQEDLDRLFTEPRSIEDAYPLSPLQQGMLFHSLGAPDSGVYVEQLSCTLSGDLDAATLSEACRDVVARHPVLRTSFLWDGLAEPVQVVHRRVHLPLPFLSWTSVPQKEQARRLDELLREDRRRGFELARAPLLRAILIELAPGVHRFVWTMHHLVGDGWSAPVVVRELLTFYDGRLRGVAVAMEQARPFRDYIEWIARQSAVATEAFWRRELAGFTAPTPLGVDRPGQRRELGHGDERARLSREATAALEALARGSKLTLNTLVQGAWALLLARYSGEEDVLFGITVSGRPAALRGAETMVGPFISTLPLRAKIPARVALLPWLEELQRCGLDRQDHEYSSFVQPWSEVPIGLPLFETLLVFENYPRTPAAEVARRADPAARPALETRDLHSLVRTRYAVNAVVNPGAEMQLYLSYDRSRFDSTTARRMRDHLANLLAAFTADPTRTLAELPMLAEAERRQLFAERTQAGDLLVLGPDLHLSPLEVPGELHVGLPAGASPNLAMAPWDAALALLPTGEWARRLADGQLRLLGRRTDRVLVHGRPVWLREVEAAIARHAGVREAVVSLEDGALAAWIAPAAAKPPAAAELRAFVEELLPRYMIPRSFLPLPDQPRTAAGRIDRAALSLHAKAAGAGEPSLSQLTDLLVGLWSEVLGIDSLRADDSFLDLGGSSLVASRLVSRLRTTLGIEVPLRVLFEAPAAADLAQWIERKGAAAAAPAPALEPVPRDRPLPLSFAQQRLWFLDQLAPGDVSYNVPAPVRLSGDLDVGALDLTFAEVVRRHEALRTTFPDQEGHPTQRISPPRASRLPVVDLVGLPAARRESEARRLAEADARTPFDLARGPLLRTVLMRLDRAEHVLLFSTHHIVSDAWSIAVLVREIGILYQAFSAGRPSPLAELPVQYADYADWQRRWLDGEVLEAHLAYWRRHLGGTPRVLDLATDRPRPERPSGRGRQRVFTLPADLSRAVVALGRREGTTPFMTLLAPFAALLGRVSGSSEVILGMPVAGRSRLETEGMIGFFVNVLPLRLDLSRSPTFRELLRQAREATLGAFAHQELPLEKLVEALEIERRQDRSLLFQVTFGLQNAPEADADLPGLRLEALAVENETMRFDLTVWVKETREGLGVQWTFSTDLFDLSTIERMQSDFEALLAGAMAAPEKEINRILSAAERRRRQRAELESEESRHERLLTMKPRPVRPVDPRPENAEERTDTL